jgi:hypothetical protein
VTIFTYLTVSLACTGGSPTPHPQHLLLQMWQPIGCTWPSAPRDGEEGCHSPGRGWWWMYCTMYSFTVTSLHIHDCIHATDRLQP